MRSRKILRKTKEALPVLFVSGALAISGCGQEKQDKKTTAAQKKPEKLVKKPKNIPGCNSLSVRIGKKAAYHSIVRPKDKNTPIADAYQFSNSPEMENEEDNAKKGESTLVIDHVIAILDLNTGNVEPLDNDEPRVLHLDKQAGEITEKFALDGKVNLDYTKLSDGSIGLVGRVCTGIISSKSFDIPPSDLDNPSLPNDPS